MCNQIAAQNIGKEIPLALIFGATILVGEVECDSYIFPPMCINMDQYLAWW